jgi:hypothetical protein
VNSDRRLMQKRPQSGHFSTCKNFPSFFFSVPFFD